MFRQPDSLYAGVLLCSAIILAVVGGSLFWLRMPGDERLRNYRLSRRFVGWAYFSLAFTDVLWLLFLREEYELDFTRILVLAVAAVQATMFSGALVTLVNSRFRLRGEFAVICLPWLPERCRCSAACCSFRRPFRCFSG